MCEINVEYKKNYKQHSVSSVVVLSVPGISINVTLNVMRFIVVMLNVVGPSRML
jgi:hypothetical protein